MILFLAAAFAQDLSEPAPVVLRDDLEFLSFATIDTGWQPSSDAFLAVRFQVVPAGGVLTEMQAESELSWTADGFEQRFLPVLGSGLFGIDTSLTLDFDAAYNVDIITTTLNGTVDVWDTTLSLLEVVPVDTLLLPESPVDEARVVVDDVGTFQPFSTTIGIIPTVNLEVAVDVVPELTSVFAGRSLISTLAGEEQTLLGEHSSLFFAPPFEAQRSVDLEASYLGDLTTLLDLVVVPSLTLDSPVGDWELASFDLPIPILDLSSERELEPQFAHHGLPAMGPVVVDAVGSLYVGERVNIAIPIESLGELALEGTARIEGGDGFSVWPPYFAATDGNTTGLVVSFAPSEPGEQFAALVIETNDPSADYLRIPLQGVGLAVESPVDDEDELPPDQRVDGESVRGRCGCSTGGTPQLGGLLGLGLLLFARRQDRRSTNFTR